MHLCWSLLNCSKIGPNTREAGCTRSKGVTYLRTNNNQEIPYFDEVVLNEEDERYHSYSMDTAEDILPNNVFAITCMHASVRYDYLCLRRR